MSYGLKYSIDAFRDTSTIGNNLWRIHIYQSGYSGSSSQVTGSDAIVHISYKKQDIWLPLSGSECTIGLKATTSTTQYDEFLTAAPLAYYVVIYKSTNDGSTWDEYWQGVNTTDTFSRAESNNPYDVMLKFNCGLGELQWHRYENSNTLFESFEQVIQIINNCLSFLPYNLNVREIINIREDTMSDSSGLLEQLYLDDAAFYELGDDQLTHGMPCSKVLSILLTALNCRIYQSNNMWFIERVYERTKTTVTYFDYTTGAVTTSNSMAHSATGTLDWRRTINNSSFPKLLSSSEKAVTTKHPVTVYNLNTSSYNNDQLVPNPFFEDTPQSKNATGKPLRWDRSSDVNTKGGDSLLLVDPYNGDPRYRWAYDFGSTIEGQNAVELDAVSSYYMGSSSYPSTYYIHAVLQPGDTYTRPWVYIDNTNGSLNINIQLFIEISLTPDASTNTAPASQVDFTANGIMNNLALIPYFKIQLTNGSSTYSVTNWLTPSLGGGDAFFIGEIMLSELCASCYYPHDGTTQVPLSISGLGGMLRTNAGKSFPIKFRYQKSFNVPLSGITSAGIYKFDCKCWAAYYDRKALYGFPNKLYINPWSVSGYGINAIDVQYKDSFQSATPYAVFYAAPDTDTRWNQLKIDVQLGDTLTPCYPGSFRLSTGAQTGTWHNKGLTDTGQALASILFENFAQIPAVYRKNIRGHIFDNSLQYFHTIVDEDGALYLQTQHDFDIKSCAYQTDMDEMADTGLVITPIKGWGVTPVKPAPGKLPPGGGPQPIHIHPTTPVSHTVPVILTTPSTYPSAS